MLLQLGESLERINCWVDIDDRRGGRVEGSSSHKAGSQQLHGAYSMKQTHCEGA